MYFCIFLAFFILIHLHRPLKNPRKIDTLKKSSYHMFDSVRQVKIIIPTKTTRKQFQRQRYIPFLGSWRRVLTKHERRWQWSRRGHDIIMVWICFPRWSEKWSCSDVSDRGSDRRWWSGGGSRLMCLRLIVVSPALSAACGLLAGWSEGADGCDVTRLVHP